MLELIFFASLWDRMIWILAILWRRKKAILRIEFNYSTAVFSLRVEYQKLWLVPRFHRCFTGGCTVTTLSTSYLPEDYDRGQSVFESSCCSCIPRHDDWGVGRRCRIQSGRCNETFRAAEQNLCVLLFEMIGHSIKCFCFHNMGKSFDRTTGYVP